MSWRYFLKLKGLGRVINWLNFPQTIKYQKHKRDGIETKITMWWILQIFKRTQKGSKIHPNEINSWIYKKQVEKIIKSFKVCPIFE